MPIAHLGRYTHIGVRSGLRTPATWMVSLDGGHAATALIKKAAKWGEKQAVSSAPVHGHERRSSPALFSLPLKI